MPKPKQTEKLAADAARAPVAPTPSPDDDWWNAVLSDPRAAGKPWLPIEQCRLSEVPRHLLRVECLRCFRTVEIQKVDAIRMWGPHVVLKDLAEPLLEPGCTVRSGSHEEAKEGFPKIDVFFGGRYWPAVVEFFRLRYGVTLDNAQPPLIKQGVSSRIRIVPPRPDNLPR